MSKFNLLHLSLHTYSVAPNARPALNWREERNLVIGHRSLVRVLCFLLTWLVRNRRLDQGHKTCVQPHCFFFIGGVIQHASNQIKAEKFPPLGAHRSTHQIQRRSRNVRHSRQVCNYRNCQQINLLEYLSRGFSSSEQRIFFLHPCDI